MSSQTPTNRIVQGVRTMYQQEIINKSLFNVLKAAGVLIILVGLQSYGFHGYFKEATVIANQNLERLTGEISSNTRIDTVLNRFADLRRVTENEALRNEILQTYQRFIEQFKEDRLTAIEEFARVVSGFSIKPDSAEEEAFSVFLNELALLQDTYYDHYGELAAEFKSPPFYYQPTAVFLKRDTALANSIQFNNALYLSLVGDRNTANTIFNDLKSRGSDKRFMSRVHYAQARMLYDAFLAQNNMEYYQQAIQNTRQSLQYDPGYGTPKLFLEYLLSMESGMQAQDVPMQGEGSGEAKGERGVISSQPPIF